MARRMQQALQQKHLQKKKPVTQPEPIFQKYGQL